MPNVVRSTDINVAGGQALGGATTVTAEGLPVMQPGMTVTPHPPAPNVAVHASATTNGGSSSVTVEGKPVIHSNDMDTCGDKRSTFAATVTVGL